jgi:hypothetical protein
MSDIPVNGCGSSFSYLAVHLCLRWGVGGGFPGVASSGSNEARSGGNGKGEDHKQSRLNCLTNIDSNTRVALGLDAVGLAASLTGLRGAWELASAAVSASNALLSLTVAAFTGENAGQAVALGGTAVAVGAPLYSGGATAATKAVASSLPLVGAGVAAGVLAYDALDALKKAGCF